MPYLWDQNPIQIDSKSTPEEQRIISLKASVTPDSSLLPSYTGISIALTIRVSENVVEIENHHTSSAIEMKLTNVPNDSDGKYRWVLFKLKRKIVIVAKGRTVWEMEYIKLFDTKYDDEELSQRSMRAWSKSAVDITFNVQDTVTRGYRKSCLISVSIL